MISLFNYNVFRQTVTPVFISSDIQHVLSRNHSFESGDGFLFEVFPASGSRVGVSEKKWAVWNCQASLYFSSNSNQFKGISF